MGLTYKELTAREVFEFHYMHKYHVRKDGDEHLYERESSDTLLPDTDIPVDLTKDNLDWCREMRGEEERQDVLEKLRGQRKYQTDLMSNVATSMDNAIKRTRIEMARKFLAMDVPSDLIVRVTELPRAEVEKLRGNE